MLEPSSARGALRYRLARLLQARPPVVWTAALLYLCGGVACLASVVFPISSQEPVRLDLAIGVMACALAAGLWTLGRRLPSAALAWTMALGSLAVSAIVANARTSGGAMLAAYAYPWIAVYTAHFCSRRAVIAQSLLISVGFGVGLVAGGLPNMGIDWVIVTGTVWSTALVLGRLSDSLRQRADTDPLTGLLNRNGFLTAATRDRRPHAHPIDARRTRSGWLQADQRPLRACRRRSPAGRGRERLARAPARRGHPRAPRR